MPRDPGPGQRLGSCSSGDSTTGKTSACLLRWLLTKIVTGAILLLVPLAYTSPPDQTWIAGLYDDNDYDEVVALATDGTAASSNHALGQLEPRPLPCLALRLLGVVPDAALHTATSRGPPIQVRNTSLNPRPQAPPRHVRIRSGCWRLTSLARRHAAAQGDESWRSLEASRSPPRSSAPPT
jgi:hypothetical protein